MNDSHLIVQPFAADASSPADQSIPIPLYTYLRNAGLSPDDVRRDGDEIWRRIRARIAVQALSDDADKRRRYMRDWQYRRHVNMAAIAEVIVDYGFNAAERTALDEGLRIGGIAPVAEKPKNLIARTVGPNGEEQEFEVLELSKGEGSQNWLRDRKTGLRYVL